MRSFLLPAAKLRMYVNGKPFAIVTEFQWNSETQRKPLQTVDVVDAFELAPTTIRVNGSMTVLRQSGDGGAEGHGLTAPQDDLTREKYFSLVLKDSSADTIIFQATRCSLVSQAWHVGATQGFMRGQLNFMAIDWANETRIER